MKTPEVVGVVGASGDLGSRLCDRINSTIDGEFFAFDLQASKGDPLDNNTWLPNLKGILDKCTVIHWCAPPNQAFGVEYLDERTLLVLHDSVMRNSKEVGRKLKRRETILGSLAAVHLLMNDEQTAVLEAGSDDQPRLSNHLTDIGLRPVVLEARDHDAKMAESQAIYAVLHEMGILVRLEQYDELGLLTPSGKALFAALKDRSAKWTPATLKSITSNPELPGFISDMASWVDSRRDGR